MSKEYEVEAMQLDQEEVLTPAKRLIDIFFSPGKVFKSIAIKPNRLLPLVVIGVVTFLLFLLSMGNYKDLMISAMEQQYAQMGIEMSGDYIETITNIMGIVSLIFSPIAVVAGVFLSALYYWLFVKILKGVGTYKQYASVMAHVAMITVLATLVSGITTILTGEYALVPLTSLASLLPEGMKQGFLYGALSAVEVFNIWRVILIAIALKQISGLKNSKITIIVGIAFALGLCFSGISLGMNAAMM